MGQTANQIERQIEIKREDLKSNLEELEDKVKSATDWRRYYRKHTGAMVAAAFGGGLALSSIIGKRSRASSAPATAGESAVRVQGGAKHDVIETFDTVRNALVGIAATKFKGMLGELVPGFSEHLEKIERTKSRDTVG